ncbi:MFS transporter [Luteibacter sp. 3190]|uniref:MFS transporter n=1 Tax=Luteibacter sp. 3190 TaxID=2817736 RepID=UPI002859854D|nr:MFS transporter [Luteibacter sp. 3190]MDR6935331.1 MFS family permease [Luteibacter sp. 3190]
MKARSAVISLMLAGFTAGGSEMLVLALLVRQQQLDALGVSASLIYVGTLVGTGCMGVLGGYLLANLRPSAIGLSSPVLCALAALTAYLTPSGTADFFVAAFVSLVTALDLPNINSTVNSLVSARERSSAFSLLQSSISLLVVIAPIVSAGLILVLGVRLTFLPIAAIYLVSALPWFWMPSQGPHARPRGQEASAYRLIATDSALRTLMIFRLLSNFVYVAIPVTLPFLLSKIADNHGAYVPLQATSLAFLRAGPLAASLIGALLLARNPGYVTTISVVAPLLGAGATVVMAFSQSSYLICACCLLIGFTQYGVRLTGMVLGPSVTPNHRLAEVILASDTIIRLFAACYAAGLVFVFRYPHGEVISLVVAAACCLPAPAFLKGAFISYRNQLSEVKS